MRSFPCVFGLAVILFCPAAQVGGGLSRPAAACERLQVVRVRLSVLPPGCSLTRDPLKVQGWWVELDREGELEITIGDFPGPHVKRYRRKLESAEAESLCSEALRLRSLPSTFGHGSMFGWSVYFHLLFNDGSTSNVSYHSSGRAKVDEDQKLFHATYLRFRRLIQIPNEVLIEMSEPHD